MSYQEQVIHSAFISQLECGGNPIQEDRGRHKRRQTDRQRKAERAENQRDPGVELDSASVDAGPDLCQLFSVLRVPSVLRVK